MQVTVYDDDIVTEANIGRQLFCPCDVGQDKASVLVSRVNSFFGLNWESLCAHETVSSLPTVDKFFDLTQVDEAESGPSCSLAEALQKQDLFINSTLAQLGCALLWKLITEGSITTNGLYLNLSTMKVNPIKL